MSAFPEIFELRVESFSSTVQKICDGIDRILVYRTPLNVQFRGITVREGLLFHGPVGWGEAAPFWDYAPPESARWLVSALEYALEGSLPPLRPNIPVNVTIPVVSPAQARRRVLSSGGCATAKVKVADPRSTIKEDIARVQAVAQTLRETVGERGSIRIDANGAWTVTEALRSIDALNEAARDCGGLEYAEQPCRTVSELAQVRRGHSGVLIAADESIRRSSDPMRVVRMEAADVAVIKVAPLGGIRMALHVAQQTGLKIVVSSALETSIGLAQGVRAAAALPELSYACGLATSHILAHDIVRKPLLPADGNLSVPEGIAPDESLIIPEGECSQETTVESGVGGEFDGRDERIHLCERWRSRLEEMCECADTDKYLKSEGADKGEKR